ncbi:MAG TPA: DeoR/GlpR family DNA-binding transcription regulator [Paenibacillus sp.]|uniref:DeoR/GlpR family DNA-binding transcription regulator n=1 Tax=Paenibacillus sp. TaxID=58172 RepID=UPI002CD97A09|nr:DeoR/GlpR family DNA-binding transcription regulator [Paenibacillus sp.]HUC92415.1 DeoR/GlpR family DNA-binding transcription regulator [Paenibacillus sp.]
MKTYKTLLQRVVMMAKMFKTERKEKILSYLKINQRATVKELSEILSVSEATLRSDLQILEEEGLLQRTHGGALLHEETNPEHSFVVREKKNQEEKTAIGMKAAEMVVSGQCILLDASSTALELAKALKRKPHRLTVVTSGIYSALELRDNPAITVILAGGVVRVGSNALEGTLGANILRQINVDIMFTSASGFTIEDGLTDFNVYEVELKKEMVRASKRVVGLLDHSKIGKSSISSFALPNEIESVITDSKLSRDQINQIKQAGINVIIA